jgi:hypothetical protein
MDEWQGTRGPDQPCSARGTYESGHVGMGGVMGRRLSTPPPWDGRIGSCTPGSNWPIRDGPSHAGWPLLPFRPEASINNAEMIVLGFLSGDEALRGP